MPISEAALGAASKYGALLKVLRARTRSPMAMLLKVMHARQPSTKPGATAQQSSPMNLCISQFKSRTQRLSYSTAYLAGPRALRA